jgi:hypothetical protein
MISGQCVSDIFLLAWLINVITKKRNIPTAYTEKKGHLPCLYYNNEFGWKWRWKKFHLVSKVNNKKKYDGTTVCKFYGKLKTWNMTCILINMLIFQKIHT